MDKILINKPILEEILLREDSKDGRRRALGYITKKEIPDVISQMQLFLTDMDIKSWESGIGQYDIKYDFYSEDLFKQLEIENRKIRVGIFIEPCKTIINGEKVEDENRYMIWIYFTLKTKRLTKFKKFLLQNIFEYKE